MKYILIQISGGLGNQLFQLASNILVSCVLLL